MNNNKYKILLVEDEGNILNFVTALLEANDYRVISAKSYASAKTMYASHIPDLVILDLGLPDKDGSVLLKEIRAKDLTPVIVLSARSEEREKVKMLDMGANDYITKPFGSEELLARVRAALRNSRHSMNAGYLPGGKNDKLQSWMQPIFDNLEYLLEGSSGNSRQNPERQVSNLVNKGTLQLEAITYIRGRSIPEHFVIIDEAQNLTPHEVKTIISRAGEGTKMVLTGDPQQIDNPYLDASSNGLSVTVEQFKNEKIHGHVTLRKSERSELAALAARLL